LEQEIIMNEGQFFRLPKDVIKTELFVARQKLNQFTDRVTSGNDADPKELNEIMKMLKDVSTHIKKFSNASEVIGTVYEAEVAMESVALKESFEAFLNEGNATVNDAIDILKTLHGFSGKIKFSIEDVNGYLNIVYDDPKGVTTDCLKRLKDRKFWNTDFAPTTGTFPGGRVNINFGKSAQAMLNLEDFDKKVWSPK